MQRKLNINRRCSLRTSSSATGHVGNSSNRPVSDEGHGIRVSEKMWNSGGSSPFFVTSVETVSINCSRSAKYSNVPS